jgi:hypothetical protein
VWRDPSPYFKEKNYSYLKLSITHWRKFWKSLDGIAFPLEERVTNTIKKQFANDLVGTKGGTGQNLMTPSWKGGPDFLHELQINSTVSMLWKEPKWPSCWHHTPCPSVSYLIAGRFPS